MQNRQSVLARYVSDIAALETLLLETVLTQHTTVNSEKFPEAGRMLYKIEHVMRMHLARLDALQQKLGSPTFSRAKETLSAVAGLAAGVFDQFRTHPISKLLRDDYTTLSLAAISYTMLHTTALAFKHEETAQLSLQHLEEITPLIVEVSEIMPGTVVNEFVKGGEMIDAITAPQALRNTQAAWRSEVVGKEPAKAA